MNHFPMNLACWQSGLTLDEFVAEMKTHQARMRSRLREVKLPTVEHDYFAHITSPVHALVMTEDWCGDSLMNIPILARIAEATPSMDLRIFDRAKTPELNNYYTARGITHIPVFTFLDGDFNEIGTWIERSKAAHAQVEQWMTAHPVVTALLHDPKMTAEERHRVLGEKFGGLLIEMESWYASVLQRATVDEIKSLLTPIADALPVRI